MNMKNQVVYKLIEGGFAYLIYKRNDESKAEVLTQTYSNGKENLLFASEEQSEFVLGLFEQFPHCFMKSETTKPVNWKRRLEKVQA